LWTDAIEIAFILVGTFFMFVASLGVLRLPDFYLRIHAPTKAATLGMFSLLVAVTVALAQEVVLTKALLAVAFIGATTPVSAHILFRATYRSGVPFARPVARDDYRSALRARAAKRGEERPPPSPPAPKRE
jgi:multicomponent Na+:H+ antiporter subunit G